ncbi:type I pantothenate kinase [Pseudomonas sp. TH31]|jgi:type I pantothenate kinase|uniref:type I pantothenate kinase n=1 Tax=Pseudomonas sp. TH31 TaxID=2796396 RepID=UPI0019145258|nr:type I pantothenate kinase [Pseudomonas sp. TH31]MBK5413965.1 type I pantothenate kinase [Pseudomonas sp. TH31]
MRIQQDALAFSQAHHGYWEFSREQWSSFRDEVATSLSSSEMSALNSATQPITTEEVMNILLPLSRLLNLHSASAQSFSRVHAEFMGVPFLKQPYVIGISGSVAVGKSSFARVLSALLSSWPGSPSVQLVTTDSFLFPLATLEEKNILHRKGFPESYDTSSLLDFLHLVRHEGQAVQIPIYSHVRYDILPNEMQQVQASDIIVLEGLNVLQENKNPGLNILDFVDFSIYIDASAESIKKWYLERFVQLKNTAFQSSESYFNKFKYLTDDEAVSMACDTWNRVNFKNLVENILPSRDRASLIVKKSPDHSIDKILLRSFEERRGKPTGGKNY